MTVKQRPSPSWAIADDFRIENDDDRELWMEEYERTVPKNYQLRYTDLDLGEFPMYDLYNDTLEAIKVFRQDLERCFSDAAGVVWSPDSRVNIKRVYNNLFYARITDLLYPMECPITIYHDEKDFPGPSPIEEMHLPSVALFKRTAIYDLIGHLNQAAMDKNRYLNFRDVSCMLIDLLIEQPSSTPPELHIQELIPLLVPEALNMFLEMLSSRTWSFKSHHVRPFFDHGAALAAIFKFVRENPNGNFLRIFHRLDELPVEPSTPFSVAITLTSAARTFLESFGVHDFGSSEDPVGDLVILIDALREVDGAKVHAKLFGTFVFGQYLDNAVASDDVDGESSCEIAETPDAVLIALRGAISYVKEVLYVLQDSDFRITRDKINRFVDAVDHAGLRALWRHAFNTVRPHSRTVRIGRILLNHFRFRAGVRVLVVEEDPNGGPPKGRSQIIEAGFAARYLFDIHGNDFPALGYLDETYVPPEARNLPKEAGSAESSAVVKTHRSIRGLLMPLSVGTTDHELLDAVYETYSPTLLEEEHYDPPSSPGFVGDDGVMMLVEQVVSDPTVDDTHHRIDLVEDCYLRTEDDDDDRAAKRARKGKQPARD